MKTLVSIGLALILAAPTAAEAGPKERWLLSAGGGLARAVTAPQADLYGLGATGSGGFYRSLMPWMLLGTRFTASMVSNQAQSPGGNLAEPGTGGLFTLTLAGRLRPFADSDVAARATGLFLEGGGGVARTGSLWRSVLEAGLGYGFNLGPVVLSPVLRFQQVVETGDLAPDDARIVSAGLELTFNDGTDDVAPQPDLPVFITMAPEDTDHDGLADVEDPCPFLAEDVDGFRDDDGCPDHDVDSDGIADLDDNCPDEPETVNGVNDHDGCPDSGRLEVVRGVIVVDERILFGFDSATIRPEGLEKLMDLAASAGEHPEWVGMVVEGHADRRGTKDYNRALSLRRAKAVQAALRSFGLGVPMKAEGYGEDRLLDRGDNAEAHRKNRRVEIRVQKERQRTAEVGTAPMSLYQGAGR